MIQENISLKPYNTFGVDVSARYFAEVNSVEDLKETLKLFGMPKSPRSHQHRVFKPYLSDLC